MKPQITKELKKTKKQLLYTLGGIFLFLCLACKTKTNTPKYTQTDAELVHGLEKKLTDLIVLDIFSPPVASRVYVYPFLAGYEAAKFSEPNATSITAQLQGFAPMPQPESGKEYDFTVSSVQAFCETAKKVVFSTEPLSQYQKQLLDQLKDRNDDETFERSVALGDSIAKVVLKRWSTDNYKQTRGMEKFEVRSEKGRWVPTLPDYADAVEPHWGKMKPLVMDSSSQCRPTPPAPYSEQKGSSFWTETQEVYDISKKIGKTEDEIIRFWDDNPFVSRTMGHLMYQEKKMTPGGHWMAICRSFSRYKKVDFFHAFQHYALLSVGIYDAFISCWEEKYRSARVRPETVIIAKIDQEWKPYLVTPLFPAYTSGHSTVSAAAAHILTNLYGNQVAYTDTTEKEYGLPVRSFKSFNEAALEASKSRILAGIHYRSDCEAGNKQGIRVGELVMERVKIK